MAEPLITIHGDDCTQTNTDWVIKKANLPTVVPAANNNAESLQVGLIKRWLITCPETGFSTDFTRQTQVTKGTPYFTADSNGNQYKVTPITILLREPDTSDLDATKY